MTVKEAIELEKEFEEGLSFFLGTPDIQVSLALSGRFRISDGSDYICINTKTLDLDYIKYTGYKSDLDDFCSKCVYYIQENRPAFELLISSYEHQSELTEE